MLKSVTLWKAPDFFVHQGRKKKGDLERSRPWSDANGKCQAKKNRMQKTQRLLQPCGNSPEGAQIWNFLHAHCDVHSRKKSLQNSCTEFCKFATWAWKMFRARHVFDKLKLAHRNQNFTKTDGDCPEGLDMNMDFLHERWKKCFMRDEFDKRQKKSCNYARNLEHIFFAKPVVTLPRGSTWTWFFFARHMHRARNFLHARCIARKYFFF